ncbi:kinase-like domain-containing protein [Lyophyllum atratum]|nr:kinase-like domain-containing protein [Lyophyllum atratum]
MAPTPTSQHPPIYRRGCIYISFISVHVVTWMENGTVLDLRAKNRKQNFEIDRLVLEVAEGLEYLNFEKIFHGGLRGVNILIDEGKHAGLSDFVLTVHADASANESHRGGNIQWMSRELFVTDDEDESVPQKAEETDVYSVACVISKLYEGQYPLYDVLTDATVLRQVLKGIRPSRPRDEGRATAVPEHIWGQLVEKCWHHDRYERPTMDHAVRLPSTRFGDRTSGYTPKLISQD